MTLDLDPIRARAQEEETTRSRVGDPWGAPYSRDTWISAAIASAKDVPDLVAEVERLRAALTEIRGHIVLGASSFRVLDGILVIVDRTIGERRAMGEQR